MSTAAAIATPPGQRRIELWDLARKKPLRLVRSDLRFSLGVSAADLRVPFHLDAGAQAILSRSTRQLALLLVSRHRDLLSSEDFDRYLLLEEFGTLPAVPRTLSAPSGGPETRACAEAGHSAHPLLAGGVLAAWLGAGGGGRSLVGLILALLRQAVEERKQTRNREDTPTLVLLFLSQALPRLDGELRTLAFPGAADRLLRGATEVGVFLALRMAVPLVARELPAWNGRLGMGGNALSAALLGGKQGVSAAGATLYGADLAAGMPYLDEALISLERDTDAESLRAMFDRALASQGEVAKRADRAVAEAALQSLTARCARYGEQGAFSEELVETFRELSLYPSSLRALLEDDKGRKQLAKDVAREAERMAPTVSGALSSWANALRNFSPKEPGASAGLSKEHVRQIYAGALTALTCDLALERKLAALRKCLVEPTGAEQEGGIAASYEQGRLYRLSTRNERILKPPKSTSLGHLFVDVKDFTRRTALLGQATMADFLRREFYLPILSSAKAHYGGLVHLEDRGGVTLNNLLGDALSMSGDVEALVVLAREIRRHLLSYERHLQRAVSQDAVEQAVSQIQAQFAQRGVEPDADAAALAAEKEAALAHARGEGLEAGVFVSHGPAPLVITLEDEVFGRSRVAIADRINESARGTARVSGARADADRALAASRAQLGNPQLRHAWRVFVGAPLSVHVPPAQALQARTAMRTGDERAAMMALAIPVRDALRALAVSEAEAMGDIYNAGAALSGEALAAYREKAAGRRTFRDVELRPEALHPEVRRQLFFGDTPCQLAVGFDEARRPADLFRLAGQALFKGFERGGGIPVWELVCDPAVEDLLARYHAAAWFGAA